MVMEVDSLLQHHFWTALCRSRWTDAQELRHLLCLHDWPHCFDVRGLSNGGASPQRLCEVIEQLYQERLLKRMDASTLQSAILDWTDDKGSWKPRTIETVNLQIPQQERQGHVHKHS